jgi:hypothetical protein
VAAAAAAAAKVEHHASGWVLFAARGQEAHVGTREQDTTSYVVPTSCCTRVKDKRGGGNGRMLPRVFRSFASCWHGRLGWRCRPCVSVRKPCSVQRLPPEVCLYSRSDGIGEAGPTENIVRDDGDWVGGRHPGVQFDSAAAPPAT